tara:strand:+ start:364 stop:516 length:153 start_codon:yes stop_codon:yes gene_type:complete
MGLLDKLAQRDPKYNKDLNPNQSKKDSGKRKLLDIFHSNTSHNGQPNDNN